MNHCKTCKHADTVSAGLVGQSITVCRYNPPDVAAMVGRDGNVRQVSLWPEVKPNTDWCAHHEVKS